MANESGEFHFHVEYSVSSDEAGFEDIPGGRNVYLDQFNAISVAQDYLLLQETIYRGYLKDEGYTGTLPNVEFVKADDRDENVVFQGTLENVHTGDVLTVRTIRCDAPKVRVSNGEDAVSQLLEALFGEGGGDASFVVISVDESGNAEVQKTDAYGTKMPKGTLGEGVHPGDFFRTLFSVSPTTDIDGEDNLSGCLLPGGLQKVS